MRQVITALIAMTCLILLAADPVPAQGPTGVSVGFRNRSDTNVLVKGYTIVNGTQRSGQILPLKKGGGMAFESVPAGIRYYTLYDANQSGRVLLRDFRVPIQNRDVSLAIVRDPNNPNILTIVPD